MLSWCAPRFPCAGAPTPSKSNFLRRLRTFSRTFCHDPNGSLDPRVAVARPLLAAQAGLDRGPEAAMRRHMRVRPCATQVDQEHDGKRNDDGGNDGSSEQHAPAHRPTTWPNYGLWTSSLDLRIALRNLCGETRGLQSLPTGEAGDVRAVARRRLRLFLNGSRLDAGAADHELPRKPGICIPIRRQRVLAVSRLCNSR